MVHETTDKEKPVLLVVEGPLRGQQWVMRSDEVTIGRGVDCTIVIPERPVSRVHARISRHGKKYYVEDLNSKNGTHVNGEKLTTPRQLLDGDEIQIAFFVKLRFIGSEATVPLSLDTNPPQSEGLVLNVHTHEVLVNGTKLDPPLSLYQYRLLELLYQKNGGICSREEVVRAVWPDALEEGVSEQAIDALVRRLRDRLSEGNPDFQYIGTVRGHGFRMLARGAEASSGS